MSGETSLATMSPVLSPRGSILQNTARAYLTDNGSPVPAGRAGKAEDCWGTAACGAVSV